MDVGGRNRTEFNLISSSHPPRFVAEFVHSFVFDTPTEFGNFIPLARSQGWRQGEKETMAIVIHYKRMWCEPPPPRHPQVWIQIQLFLLPQIRTAFDL